MSDFDNLVDGDDSDFAIINPEIIATGGKIADTFLEAGFQSWSTFISRGVLYQTQKTRYLPVTDHFSEEDETQVVTTMSWTGDREGTLHLLIPESGAKSAIAFFLAVAMGTEPDPESQQLDDESMDAYSELVNTLAGQGAQALRGDPGGTINIAVTESKVVDLRATNPEEVFGPEDVLCHTALLTLEGASPVSVRLLLPISVTGMSAELEQRGGATEEDISSVLAASTSRTDRPNEVLAKRLRVPLVVVLAEKRVRMEVIRDLSPGSIIEFRKQSGEFLDICANNNKFAEGEVVIVNQHFGIQIRRVTPTLGPTEVEEAESTTS